PVPVITSALLLVNGQPAAQANAGQSGLQIRITGTSLRADTEVTVNGIVVVAHLQGSDIIINLDENVSIRNTAGPLVVRARNTSPSPSEFSNSVTAGQLVTGIEITSISRKKKESGLLQLKISGVNFPLNGTVEVRANNALVALKSVSIQTTDYIKVKIGAANVPPSGTTLRIRVVSQTGIASNEFTVTVP
ncbi:MAG TPA: hypothetical protein VKA97_12435, partial [Pyrinomonadaceae bacterium]|nr:hypothetical protein [Pyrinomonadaceae bacterium]